MHACWPAGPAELRCRYNRCPAGQGQCCTDPHPCRKCLANRLEECQAGLQCSGSSVWCFLPTSNARLRRAPHMHTSLLRTAEQGMSLVQRTPVESPPNVKCVLAPSVTHANLRQVKCVLAPSVTNANLRQVKCVLARSVTQACVLLGASACAVQGMTPQCN